MTVPPNNQIPVDPSADHETYVEVVRTPGEYQQRQVVRNNAAEQQMLLSRVTQIIWFLFCFLLAMIGIRVVLQLIGANTTAVFTQLIYGFTDLFLWPFMGITQNLAVGAMQLEITSVIAMIVYALLAWGLTRLIWVLFYHPDTTSVRTYREERYKARYEA